MTSKQIYFSNAALVNHQVIEAMMIELSEQLGLQIQIADFNQSSNDDNAPIIVLCDSIDIEEDAVLKRIEKLYYAHQPIILYEPTNNEVNHIYRFLEGKNYFHADSKGHRHTLFGIKRCELGICRILESHEKETNAITDSLIQFLTAETEDELTEQRQLCKKAAKALQVSSTNLADAAMQHVITHKFNLAGKSLSLSYYIVAAHKYTGTAADGGEDWFFIQQHGILNGGNGYDCHWAHARQNVDGESWYVGEGDVCLNYVDYYMMQNDIKVQHDEDSFDADLIYVEPEAINDVTSYTISEGVELSGSVGFEAGSDDGTVVKGNGSFSAGANFSSSYSFNVQDVTCVGTSLSSGSASASWKYNFKRAMQNRSAGKWQHLHEPAKLSYTTFSPWNSWVWKFPTKKRDNYKSFDSLFRISIMNTISRYSGSQAPKHIPLKFQKGDEKVDYKDQSFEITLQMPPLLGVDKKHILLSNEKQSTQLSLIAQGEWEMRIPSDQKWLHINKKKGNGEALVTISVDEFIGEQDRSAILTLIKKQGQNNQEEKIEVEVVQSAGSVSEN